jgi:hypothetical protein
VLPVERDAVARVHGAENAVAESEPAIGRGDAIRLDAVDEDQWKRRNASVPLVPPNPKEFDSATSIFISRAVSGT